MATYKGGKGQRGGDYRKRDTWPGQRDYNKSGSSSPGQRRSNSPAWHAQKEKEYQHKICANYLSEQWKKVEQDLIKDQRLNGTVEYVSKTPTDIKDEELCNVELHRKNSEEKPESPD